jgi:ATP-dependent 26S proteasome regulatory subunit
VISLNRVPATSHSLAADVGRIDRKIEFPLPDERTRRRIFGIHTGRMSLADDVNLEEFIMAKDDLSGADIKVLRVMTDGQSAQLFNNCLVISVSIRQSARRLVSWLSENAA